MIHTLAAAAVLFVVGHARTVHVTYGNPGGAIQAVSLFVPEAGAMLPCNSSAWADCHNAILECNRTRDFLTTNCTGTQPCTYTIHTFCLESPKTQPTHRFKIKNGEIVKILPAHP